jgi:hypothetical protein
MLSLSIRASWHTGGERSELQEFQQLICLSRKKMLFKEAQKCSINRQQMKSSANRWMSVDPIRFHMFELDRVWVIFVIHKLEYHSMRSITPSVIIDPVGVMLLEIHNDTSMVYGPRWVVSNVYVSSGFHLRNPSDYFTKGTRSLNFYQIWTVFLKYSTSTRYSQGLGNSSWNPDVLPSTRGRQTKTEAGQFCLGVSTPEWKSFCGPNPVLWCLLFLMTVHSLWTYRCILFWKKMDRRSWCGFAILGVPGGLWWRFESFDILSS